jgi:hypothetical protein
MTGAEYAKALDRLGFSNRAFCLELLGVDDRTGRDWKAAGPPAAVAALLRLAVKLRLDADRMRALLVK